MMSGVMITLLVRFSRKIRFIIYEKKITCFFFPTRDCAETKQVM